MPDLPAGLRGRALALGMLALALGLFWFACAGPLLAWYSDRAELLQQRRALASRMQAVADRLPALRREAAGAKAPAQQTLLEGDSDAVAGAALQARIEAIAAASGAQVSSLELLPVEVSGAYRRVALRVSLSGPWPALIRTLASIHEASPRMLVDELKMQPAPSITSAVQPIAATFTIFAFRAGQ